MERCVAGQAADTEGERALQCIDGEGGAVVQQGVGGCFAEVGNASTRHAQARTRWTSLQRENGQRPAAPPPDAKCRQRRRMSLQSTRGVGGRALAACMRIIGPWPIGGVCRVCFDESTGLRRGGKRGRAAAQRGLAMDVAPSLSRFSALTRGTAGSQSRPVVSSESWPLHPTSSRLCITPGAAPGTELPQPH
jgi:hypothetical protein